MCTHTHAHTCIYINIYIYIYIYMCANIVAWYYNCLEPNIVFRLLITIRPHIIGRGFVPQVFPSTCLKV